MKQALSPEQAGAVIARRYRVEAILGRGGMGVVYRVHDLRLAKDLALKRCWPRDENKRQRYAMLLEREYLTLVDLAHPRIIEVYDYGVDGFGPYYTMELLNGSDLEKVDRMEWKQACAVLRDVASSLAILHSRGLLHRDVSMRNVQYTTSGHAKLLDFGAMMSMGVCKEAVGTPPFMAPEVLQMQALDARADLFSLGALGYRLLTGRHAFPARRLAELRDVWRSKPAAPVTIAPDVPLQLSRLIMRLLTLDRAGRPQNAAEVIELVCTLANLELENAAEISRAYLTTPTLVGRDAALRTVRQQMLSLVRGDGSVLLAQGVAGSGRSRLLDACALEAKLLGAAVVRADAGDAASGEWGVARALGAQLLELFPKQAADAARLSRNQLGYVIEELRADEPMTATAYEPERSLLIRELREWMLSITKAQRLVIVVDDVDRIDEPSAALLSALANKAEDHALLIAVSVERDAKQQQSSPALRLLHELATRIELEHVQPDETEALMRSVFGDVPNLPQCATRIHGLSHGNPRAAMELAQHLVATGRARYQAGSWALPLVLDESDLPSTLAASLSARLEHLGADARELALALALAEKDTVSLAQYPALTSHASMKRVFRALDELVAARILFADLDRYSFAQRGFLSVLKDSMSDKERSKLHLRIAKVLTALSGDLLRRAHHLLAAGLDREAIELLCQVDFASHSPPLSLLENAIERAAQLAMPAGIQHRLRMALLIHAPFEMAHESFRRVAPLVIAQLERDSGLTRYRELEGLPESERLSKALANTQEAYLAAPEHERVFTVIEAIRELARLSGAIASMAAPIFDHDLLECLPVLTPLFPMSPALAIVSQIVDGARAWVSGRLRVAVGIYERVLVRIAAPDRAGFDDAQYDRVLLAITYTIGTYEATIGIENAEERAKILEKHRDLRVNAWRIRGMLRLSMGNAVEARKCLRRAELLQAQDGLKERYSGATAGMELLLHLRVGDLLNVKGLLDTVDSLAAQHPGWRSIGMLGRACFAELQGDTIAALASVEEALALAPPLRLPFYGTLAGMHVRLLASFGRLDEAVERASVYTKFCAENEMSAAVDLFRNAALVFAQAGDTAKALLLLDGLISRAEEVGSRGLGIGLLYEAGARIAIIVNDREAFDSFADRCGTEYARSQNAAVGAKLARLFEEAREHGIHPSEALVSRQRSIQPAALESEFETIHSRIAECVDRSDRGRCALTLLLQATVSSVGYLYAMGANRSVVMLAALPDPPNDAELSSWLEQCAVSWVAPFESEAATEVEDGEATLTTETGQGEQVIERHCDSEGLWFEAAPLFHEQGAERCLAAMLVLPTTANQRVILPRTLSATIARELIECGDASGWT